MKSFMKMMKTYRFKRVAAGAIRVLAVTVGLLIAGIPDAWAQGNISFGTMAGLIASMGFMAWVLWKIAEDVEHD